MRTFTDEQWREFWAQVARGQITQATFQLFLENSKRIDQSKFAPNLEGLSPTFEVQVGDRTVTCAWIPANYFDSAPSNQKVMDEIARRYLCCPSHEVAVAAFDLKKGEMAANPSVAVDGVVRTDAHGCRVVGCVSEDGHGRRLGLRGLQACWRRLCRFLVVVSE